MRDKNTNPTAPNGLPPKQGLYDPQFEHDSCGVGFVVNIKGKKSHKIIRDALTVLINLNHRGACGCEANTGDGAGILLQMPHSFFKEVSRKDKIKLPPLGDYGVGMVFLPRDPNDRRTCEKMFENIVVEEGQKFLGWRTVPTNNSSLGETARSTEPFVQQAFIRRNPKLEDEMAFERKLYVIRKRCERAIRYGGVSGGHSFYVSSLSCRTLLYKGMLLTEQMDEFFPDLKNPAMESALALVHSRFSTNTFPTWERAHPYRFIAHNGEINTLRGNVNWMHARQSMFQSDLFGEDMKKLLPIINTDGSDSAMFDNCLELLVLAGRSLPHAIMMMIPEPWTNHATMTDEKKAFYEYHSCLMEPWDGPASIAFTDGKKIGAVLDRNGLRPSRYYVTKDDMVIMASEVGVLDVPADRILLKGRLQPGRMFLVDTEEGRIVSDDEIKRQIATEQPYRDWLNRHMLELETVAESSYVPEATPHTILQRQQAFGYTFEDLRIIMAPMARDGVEAVGSMGCDTPLAVLSNKSQLLYSYFQQLFAQVTNPPIDCLREELVTSAETTIGSERNLLKPKPMSCNLIELKSPILTNEEFGRLKYINQAGFKSVTMPILFKAGSGEAGLEKAMEDLCGRATTAVEAGANILILSDRGVDQEMAPIPALLAVAGVHHHLIREGTRTRVGLVLESGEPREVHHFSLLIGYGAGAINPYLAFETLEDMIRQKLLVNITHKQACKNFVKAGVKGVVKVISKMGISTIQSYRGAQIFEAVGLHPSVVEKYLTGT
ncbi:MAG TPA: glutamate synthase central domain-containing protein, partial [Candidatus Saccharimonadales bacterium]|nr:glutamate synthase central domain-containing protein [Candidatus Saccharimonadales bacterium]